VVERRLLFGLIKKNVPDVYHQIVSFYGPCPTRKVPGWEGMVWDEEDWVYKEAAAHRDPDD